jgi:hypothetical protein
LGDKVDLLSERVAYAEGTDMKKTLDSIDVRLGHLEDKVNRLDKNQAVIYGIAGFFGVIAGLFSGWLKAIFGA